MLQATARAVCGGCLIALCAAGATLPAPAIADDSIPAATTHAPALGVGLYRGRPVTFEVVDGWAIIEGDIVLGRAEELIRALAMAGDDAASRTKGFAIDRTSMLWPKGPSGLFEIPYTIEIDPMGIVPPAETSFNTTFAGFMQFVPRTTQADYVAFVLNLALTSPCFSSVGRIGGR